MKRSTQSVALFHLIVIAFLASAHGLSVDEISALEDLKAGLFGLPASWQTQAASLACSAPWLGITCINDAVTQLSLPAMNLTGTISNSIQKLRNLTHIDFGVNMITGTIPSDIGLLPNLIALSLSNNEMSGDLPSSFSSLQHLEILNLGKNSFSGTIPQSWASMIKLKEFLLFDNMLSGSIPSIFQSMNQLKAIDFSNNQFTGEIPNSIFTLSSLRYLILTNNSVSGSISSNIGDLTTLTELELGSNLLSGTIPSTISSLKALRNFDLSRNRLTGTVPDVFEGFYHLYEISLHGNGDLSGFVPSSWLGIKTLHHLTISSTSLTLCNPSFPKGKTFSNVSTCDALGLRSCSCSRVFPNCKTNEICSSSKCPGIRPTSDFLCTDYGWKSFGSLSLYGTNFTFSGPVMIDGSFSLDSESFMTATSLNASLYITRCIDVENPIYFELSEEDVEKLIWEFPGSKFPGKIINSGCGVGTIPIKLKYPKSCKTVNMNDIIQREVVDGNERYYMIAFLEGFSIGCKTWLVVTISIVNAIIMLLVIVFLWKLHCNNDSRRENGYVPYEPAKYEL